MTLGQRTGRQVQVLEGLRPGETVIVHPGDAVREGVAYEVRPSA